MTTVANRRRLSPARPLLLGFGLLLGVCVFQGSARAEPPIESPADAACREVAKARVYSTPDPLNLGLREIGRQIYMACMSRTAAAKRPVHRKVKTRRHRRR